MSSSEWAEAERRRLLAFERAKREKDRCEELQREIQTCHGQKMSELTLLSCSQPLRQGFLAPVIRSRSSYSPQHVVSLIEAYNLKSVGILKVNNVVADVVCRLKKKCERMSGPCPLVLANETDSLGNFREEGFSAWK